jgi:branched-subunit amino acid aminotransferase/4-amino-4-deoxychorismate lyase
MIYNITPDPEHIKRFKRHCRFHAIGWRIHAWLAFYKWHKTKPWQDSRHDEWWLKPLVPYKGDYLLDDDQ